MTKTFQKVRGRHAETEELPGYPEYSRDEDIYNMAREEGEIDPENIHNMKDSSYEESSDVNADNINIADSEIDDDLEDTRNEEEENNYYSLDDNDDLEDII